MIGYFILIFVIVPLGLSVVLGIVDWINDQTPVGPKGYKSSKRVDI